MTDKVRNGVGEEVGYRDVPQLLRYEPGRRLTFPASSMNGNNDMIRVQKKINI